MSLEFAVSFRTCCLAVALGLATAHAAESSRSLIGATRDQVLARYGEPKSQISVGNRLIMFFERERVVVRDGVVVEVERLAAEPVRRPSSAPAPTPPPAAADAAAPAATPAAAPAAPPAPAAGAAPAPSAAPAPAPAAPVAESADAKAGAAAAKAGAAPAVAPPAPEPKLAIKLVRPPSGTYIRPPLKKEAPENAPESSLATAPAIVEPTPPPARSSESSPAQPASSAAPKLDSGKKTVEAVNSRTSVSENKPGTAPVDTTPTLAEAVVATEPETPAASEEAKTEDDPKEKKKKAKKAARRVVNQGDDGYDPTPEVFTTQTYVIAFLVLGGGIGYLVWRNRQRQLELAATAVSRAPFSLPVASSAGGGAVFTPDLLAKLEWKRFEELVAAYYVKTGVVAVRTKTGPASPVHIKISWKGEPRPFACVQCIAHPQGLIDATPLLELATNLTAEDIRRGYVVSTGKFNVSARDYAEEKHLTLLPGEIFLEKLNALPDSARNEIMQTVTTGDYTTPSCPKCDARMVRSADDPSKWNCPTHTDQVVHMRK